MNEPIRVGDLAVQLKGCCARHPTIGSIAPVLWMANRSAQCDLCGHIAVNQLMAGAKSSDGGVPLSWLKRIPPLADLEREQTEAKEPVGRLRKLIRGIA